MHVVSIWHSLIVDWFHVNKQILIRLLIYMYVHVGVKDIIISGCVHMYIWGKFKRLFKYLCIQCNSISIHSCESSPWSGPTSTTTLLWVFINRVQPQRQNNMFTNVYDEQKNNCLIYIKRCLSVWTFSYASL